MSFRNVALLAVSICMCRMAIPQTIETEDKPRSLVFKDAAGTVVTSIPIDKKYRVPAVKMEVSASSNTAYVLNAAGKSKERSVSAVNLATRRLDRVIKVGVGKQVDLLMSQDGRRLFAYTLSGVVKQDNPYSSAHFQKRNGSSLVITVIDTTSNEVISTFDLLHNSGLELPKAMQIQTFLSATSDGGRIIVRVDGWGRSFPLHPAWQRLAVFSVESPNSPRMIDPGKPLVSYTVSQNEKFLFVAVGDKGGHSEVVHIVNLENGKTIDRVVDPPARGAHHRQLVAFLPGAPPSWAESKQGVWIFTRGGLRFISEAGEMGDEISVPGREDAAALLSLDRTRYFMALPDNSQHSGVLDVVDLKKSTSSNRALSDAPIRLIRLGSRGGLWVMGRQEMRPISEAGEVGDRPILLNKPRRTEAGDTSNADVFLNGEPGETISLGEDHAAILITSKKGGSLHRVALLDLKQLQLDSIVTTLSSAEQRKIVGGRWLKMAGIAGLEGAAEGAIGAGAGVPLNSFNSLNTLLLPPLPGGLANEALAGRSDGRNLYVLDTDTHKVSVIEVRTAAVVGRIPVNNSVSTIRVDPDGKHLICAGVGFLSEIDLESNTNRMTAMRDP